MINAIITGIFKIVTNLVATILKPFDLIITSFIPEIGSVTNAIGSVLDVMQTGLGWAISVTGLSPDCISLIVAYFVFKVTLPLSVYVIKTAVSWYNSLKL